MKKILLPALSFLISFSAFSQLRSVPKKYPSLFWEIKRAGNSKPSYLFGTMHVSSKLVFHLPDSFYQAIKSVDVVALETNPETWQEDLLKYDFDGPNFAIYGNRYSLLPGDYLNINRLRFDKYEKLIEAALYSRPSTINNLLYRSNSDVLSDFEENTFLDMYIYQVGKKMGKRIAGVENYGESMRLMMEAYRDASKEKNKKERSYDNEIAYSPARMQEAYRTGNLDLLDSINKLNSFSEAFDEKFLYKRNVLQANAIDSIIRKSSLFVGVGAAHLPGDRGVIELLRKMGYKLRPVIMGERDSKQKDLVEKLRVPVHFFTQVSEDDFFKVDLPGKLFRFNEDGVLDQLQYADMANGSYYMVTRVQTDSHFWGQSAEVVKRKIDSLLYENIPGVILSRQPVSKNGYKGFDIVNRTRRGDVQRYNIFITPYEVIIFKMSGNGEYVRQGEEGKRFFNSIQLKELNSNNGWKKFQPSQGGFKVDLPQQPFVSNKKNWQWDAEDKSTGIYYTILRTDIHNYSFAEEDSFDLRLLEESFASSEFIDRKISGNQTNHKGFPALDASFRHKDGSVSKTRFLIHGPHYYTLVAHGKNLNGGVESFFNSFEIIPFLYGPQVERIDTVLSFKVNTTWYPTDKKMKLGIPGMDAPLPDTITNEDLEDNYSIYGPGNFRNKIIENDSTGEKIYVSFHKSGRYYFQEDSADRVQQKMEGKGSRWIIRSRKKYQFPGNWNVHEVKASDTGSSRLIWTKTFRKEGATFVLATESDTLTTPGPFLKSFFESFTPFDSIQSTNPFVKKSKLFFADYFSKDSFLHKRAIKYIDDVKLDSSDFPQLKKAIQSLNWSEKKYMEIKSALIEKLGGLVNKESDALLREMYFAAGDTISMQYEILESLLKHQTSGAFNVFKDIITIEPPVLEVDESNPIQDEFSRPANRYFGEEIIESSYGEKIKFWGLLYDSLQLTRNILPAMLPLLHVDDYKWKMMRLLEMMVDSNLVTAKDYEIYFSKFFIEAKQEFKKQMISEKKKSINDRIVKNLPSDYYEEAEAGGNARLELYATLLAPFWSFNTNIPPYFHQLLQSRDNKLKYAVTKLMLKNNKPLPDSLIKYFAANDEYRYLLYKDLSDLDQLKLFPVESKVHHELAKSKLIYEASFNKADSIVYIDKLPAKIYGREGFVYFFKYRQKKDDISWKLATSGLISKDINAFDVADSLHDDNEIKYLGSYYHNRYELTAFTDIKIREDQPITEQLQSQLKKMLYSKRRSGREFYKEDDNRVLESLRYPD